MKGERITAEGLHRRPGPGGRPAWFGSATFDETNTLTVNVGFGELASSTRDAVLNDNTINALRVGSEIIRFVTATQTGTEPNIYKLSRLLRGQLGTEWAMGDHGADEDCTLLRPQGLRNITTQAADIGQLRYVKGVTLGTSAAGVTADEFTDTAVKLKPYAPAHLRALVAASGLVTCTWERRTRYAYRWPLTDELVDFHVIGMFFLYVSLLLSIGSAVQYTVDFRTTLRQQREGAG